MERLSARGPLHARRFRTWIFGATLGAVAKNNEFVNHVVETLRDFGLVTAKPMFGGWGLYHEGLFFALVIQDALYLKVDDENRAEFDRAKLPPFTYVTK